MVESESSKMADEGPAKGLGSARSKQRLEIIAQLRTRGIGNHIALPQLVVCGDQSAGKSSVLEGLTGIPFPREDGLCTRFATEIILQHSSEEHTVSASIIPNPGRTPDEALKLRQYRVDMKTFAGLSQVINEVTGLMGVRRPGSTEAGPSFVKDVLRIEVRGPTGLHLSVVDLPGLISVANEEQSDDDVQMVHSLVDDYVADRRTIIMAVVQAGNDIANQAIIQKSRQVDPAGQRTVGIITKPDLINEGSEKRIAMLAANKDSTKLKLGFFLVKNPTPNELAKGITPDKRHKSEMRYFQSSPWKEQALDPRRIGIVALRDFMQDLLEKHNERELPRVRDEIGALLQKTENKLKALGEQRSDITRMRSFLTRIAMSFHQLTVSARDGTYDDVSGFFTVGNGEQEARRHRLRAVVENANLKFADIIRVRGHKRRVKRSPEEKLSNPEVGDSDEENVELDKGHQILLSRADMEHWIMEMYKNSRGKELAGTHNPVLLTEVFHEQASPWYSIASEHVEDIFGSIEDFVHATLRHVVKDDQVLAELKELVTGRLRVVYAEAQMELQRLWEDEQHQPMTYNHYFTDNVQKARQQTSQEGLRKAMDQTKQQDRSGNMDISNVPVDMEKLLKGLQQRINVNMSEQACAEALASLNAYYKVARKTFVDNVCRQVVERHLLRPLTNVFSPELVASMSDEQLRGIAGESTERIADREELQKLETNLRASLRELRSSRDIGRHASHGVAL